MPKSIDLIHKKLDLIARRLNIYTVERIESVVLRRFISRGGQEFRCIDYYAKWRYGTEFGSFPVVTDLLTGDYAGQRFEQWSGLRVADLPIYSGNRPLSRTADKPTKWEVETKRAFRLMIELPPDTDGPQQYPKILRFLPANYGILDVDDRKRVRAAQTAVLSPAEVELYETVSSTKLARLLTEQTGWEGSKVKAAMRAVWNDETFPTGKTHKQGMMRVFMHQILTALATAIDQDGIAQSTAVEAAKRDWQTKIKRSDS